MDVQTQQRWALVVGSSQLPKNTCDVLKGAGSHLSSYMLIVGSLIVWLSHSCASCHFTERSLACWSRSRISGLSVQALGEVIIQSNVGSQELSHFARGTLEQSGFANFIPLFITCNFESKNQKNLVYVVEGLLPKTESGVATLVTLSSHFTFTHGWAWCSLVVMIMYWVIPVQQEPMARLSGKAKSQLGNEYQPVCVCVLLQLHITGVSEV